jgi:hypothetical protein
VRKSPRADATRPGHGHRMEDGNMSASEQLSLFPATGNHPNLRHEFHDGQRFGRLVTIEDVRLRGSRGWARYWICRCDCGTVKAVPSGNLVAGRTSSCGCFHNDLLRQANFKHGLSTEPEYIVWVAMLQRCGNPKNKDYPDYGGRGITVCDRWRDFANFISDVGARPSSKYSIDRYPDNNGNYEPGNVRWATATEQVYNRRPQKKRGTHCCHGHEFTPENTYWTSDSWRVCRTCSRERARKQYYKKRKKPSLPLIQSRVEEAG